MEKDTILVILEHESSMGNIPGSSQATFIFYPTLLNNYVFRAYILYPLAKHNLFVNWTDMLGNRRGGSLPHWDNHPLVAELGQCSKLPHLHWLFNQDLKRSALGTQGKHLVCCLYAESVTNKVKKLWWLICYSFPRTCSQICLNFCKYACFSHYQCTHHSGEDLGTKSWWGPANA